MRRRGLVSAVLLLLLLAIGVGTALREPGPESAADARVAESGEQEGAERFSERTPRSRNRRGEPRDASDGSAGSAPGDGRSNDEETGGGLAGKSDPAQDGESGDEPTPEPSEAANQPPDPEKAERTVEALVRNSETGAPLANARVLVVVVGRGWHGTRTDAGGRIVKPLTKADLVGVERVELRIRAPGFALAVVPYEDTALEIALEPLREEPRPGRAELFVNLPDGTPFEGRVALSCYDPMSDHHGRLVSTDGAGRAVLHGLEPGAWRIGLPGGSFAEVHVPGGGETRVQLEVAASEPLTEEAFQEQHRALQELMTVMRSDRSESSDEPNSAAFQTVYRMQTLETRWRLQRPGRHVRFSGLPEAPEALIRIESTHGPGQVWVLPRGEGDVLLRSLPPERWRLVLLRAGERLAEQTFEVELGEGEQRVGPEPGTD